MILRQPRRWCDALESFPINRGRRERGRLSDVANVDALAEGGQGIALGNDFLGDVAFEASVYNRLHDGGIVESLGVVDLVATRNAAGVVVGDVLMIVANGQLASQVLQCRLTATWQWAILPKAPQYCRATPTEASPALGKD
jgi:hypothetical protein